MVGQGGGVVTEGQECGLGDAVDAREARAGFDAEVAVGAVPAPARAECMRK